MSESRPTQDYVHSYPDILAAFVPTPPDVVERMLELAGTGGDDFVLALGSGIKILEHRGNGSVPPRGSGWVQLQIFQSPMI